MEMDYVSHRTVELYTSLKKKAENDQAQMGMGLVLFRPALLFLEGRDGPEAVEYSNLRGEYKALRSAAVQQRCELDALPRSPEDLIAENAAEEEKEKQEDA